jgi:pyruvate dehydrogenase E1 component alpha subunit
MLRRVLSAPVRSLNRFASSASFDFNPCILHDIAADAGPPTSGNVTAEEAVKYYTQMQTIRRMELKADQLYKQKVIRGFCHLYDGQEACCVGMENAIEETDDVITSYRAHGWTYVRGIPVKEVLAELFGRDLGCSRGRGGSMHMYADNFFGGNGIVGAQVPLGAGLAWNQKYTKNNGISISIYGDGAASQGQIFEAYNLSKLWKLPAIFVCENNQYGMGTSVDRHSASTEFYKRAGYIPGILVDGMDVVAVREATKWAKQFVLENGPLLIELKTYRYHGHSMSDPGTSYRSRDEVQAMKKTGDPITGFRKRCIDAGLMTADQVKSIDKEVKKIIEAETGEALSSPEPPMDSIAHNIVKSATPFKVRSCNSHATYEHNVNL